MAREKNIQKLEKEAYDKLVRTIRTYTVGKAQQDEIINLIYEWSELAIELEQRCNQ